MNNYILQLQKNNNDNVLNNNNLLFDQIIESDGNIIYDDITGNITIFENGTYIIDWYISTQITAGSPSVIFKLISTDGHEFYSNSMNKSSNINGIGVLTIDNAPIQISLVNNSGASVYFPNSIESKASLRIVSLSSEITQSNYCYGIDQLANFIEQIVTIYPGATVSIYLDSLVTVTGEINSIFKSTDSNIPLLVIESNGTSTLINLANVTAIYFSNSVYDNSITYLDPPDPSISDCNIDLIRNVHDYVSVGDTLSVTVGTNTSASGDVTINEYGIIVMADDTTMLIIAVPQILTMTVTEVVTGLKNKKENSISINTKY